MNTENIDISLREFLSSQIEALDRYLTTELSNLRRETNLANENADKAIGVAAHEASERLLAHNGLIDQMQAQQSTFAPRESLESFKEEYRRTLEELKDTNSQRISRVERFQAMLTGAIIFVSFIGVANLVKVWGG